MRKKCWKYLAQNLTATPASVESRLEPRSYSDRFDQPHRLQDRFQIAPDSPRASKIARRSIQNASIASQFAVRSSKVITPIASRWLPDRSSSRYHLPGRFSSFQIAPESIPLVLSHVCSLVDRSRSNPSRSRSPPDAIKSHPLLLRSL